MLPMWNKPWFLLTTVIGLFDSMLKIIVQYSTEKYFLYSITFLVRGGLEKDDILV